MAFAELSSPSAVAETTVTVDPAPLALPPAVHRRGSSFFLPMLVLPAAKRRAMRSLYYFCRAADDAVDEAPDEASAQANLAFWREELARIYGEKSESPLHPIGQGLRRAVREFDLPREPFDEMLSGFAQDAARPVALQSWDDLRRYCHAVAGCVGLQAVRIFGCAGPAGEAFAAALGQALQLTNILRDIEEDGERGRCYLPRDWLAEAGLQHAVPESLAVETVRLRPLRQRLAEKAEQAFAEAERQRQGLSARRMMPALLMRDIYFRYLQALKRGGVPRRPGPLEWAGLSIRALRYYRESSAV